MSATNPFLIFTDRLNQLRVRYMVTGSVASMAYGERDIEGILAVSAAARAGAQFRILRRQLWRFTCRIRNCHHGPGNRRQI